MTDAATTSPAAAAAPLGYASPQEARPKVGLYRVAVFCAAVPLAVGVLTLGLYALTFWEWLPFAGFFVFLGGGVLCLVGLVCVTVFYAGLRRCDADLRRAWSPRAARTSALLLANVPIAIFCAGAGIYLMSQWRVTLVNDTPGPVTDITITSPGETVVVERLDPGEDRNVLMSVGNDGEITFTASQDGRPVTGVAAGYVTHGMGGKSTVTFMPGGPQVED